MSKAVIGKPAPAFTAQAIVNGEIKEISLSDYKGASCREAIARALSTTCASRSATTTTKRPRARDEH